MPRKVKSVIFEQQHVAFEAKDMARTNGQFTLVVAGDDSASGGRHSAPAAAAEIIVASSNVLLCWSPYVALVKQLQARSSDAPVGVSAEKVDEHAVNAQYGGESAQQRGGGDARPLVDFSVRLPIKDILSIRTVFPRPIGAAFIVITLRTGACCPPFFFEGGGVRELLPALADIAALTRAADDDGTYLLSDFNASLATDRLTSSFVALDVGGGATSPRGKRTPPPAAAALAELPWAVLDTFAKVAKAVSGGGGGGGGSGGDSSVGGHLRRRAGGGGGGGGGDAAAVTAHSSLKTLRALALPAAHRAHVPLRAEIDAFERFDASLRRQRAAISRRLTTDLGDFELVNEQRGGGGGGGGGGSSGVASATSSELVSARASSPSLPPLAFDVDAQTAARRTTAVSLAEWRAAFTVGEGARGIDPMNERALRRRIFYGGLEPAARGEAWQALLDAQRVAAAADGGGGVLARVAPATRAARQRRYAQIKAQWATIDATQASMHAAYRERRHRIEKDVVRTDRMQPFYVGDDNPHLTTLNDVLLSYAFFNFDLAYVQGQNDLLSPLLVAAAGDECDAFWSFVALMDVLKDNFAVDQSGMHRQLRRLRELVRVLDPDFFAYLVKIDAQSFFFAFRWMLTLFKRELAFDACCRLWDCLFSNFYLSHLKFSLFVAVAILMKQRDIIVGQSFSFDELIKYVIDLAGTFDVDELLVDAEHWLQRFLHLASRGADGRVPESLVREILGDDV